MNVREFGRSISKGVLRQVGRAASQVQEKRPLPSDLLESEDAYLVVFDAPGVSHADVQVRYDDGAVKVRIDRFREFYEEFEMRIPGRGMALDGTVRLPGDALVDAESATATLRGNGTLTVEVPKVVSDGAEEAEDDGETVTIAEPDDGVEDATDTDAPDGGTDADGDETDEA